MTLYSPLDFSSLPMLPPLLYTSPRLSPLRPTANAIFTRLLHPVVIYGHPAPRWVVIPAKEKGEKTVDEKDSENAVDGDPHITFAETEFQTLKEKYRTPKHVPPSTTPTNADSGSLSRSPRLRHTKSPLQRRERLIA